MSNVPFRIPAAKAKVNEIKGIRTKIKVIITRPQQWTRKRCVRRHPPRCSFYGAGNCTRDNCQFLHEKSGADKDNKDKAKSKAKANSGLSSVLMPIIFEGSDESGSDCDQGAEY